MKKCSRCKEQKDYSCFTKDKSTPTGYSSYCKLCNTAYNKIFWAKHNPAKPLIYPPLPDNCVLIESISGFKNVRGYCLAISGTIYSCKRGAHGRFRDFWTELKIKIDKKGYPLFSYILNGKRCYARIHRMLATYYIPLVEGKNYINHKDGNKLNNSLDNLEWCSPSENIQHSFDKLGHTRMQGSKSPAAKLTESDIPKIRELLNNRVSTRKVAKQFGISAKIIQDIKHGKRWAHV